MAVHVERVPGEPLVIATLTGMVTREDLIQIFRESMTLTQDIPGTIYRITDTLNAEIHFGEMLVVLREMAQKNPGATADSRFVPIMVGVSDDAHLVSQSMGQQQYGGVNLQLFATMEEALHYVRECCAEHAA